MSQAKAGERYGGFAAGGDGDRNRGGRQPGISHRIDNNHPSSSSGICGSRSHRGVPIQIGIMMLKNILIAALCFAVSAAHAAATDKLKSFIAATHSAQANFTQEVQDKNGKRIQSASGTMQFERPGKFRWDYAQPSEQLILANGKEIWFYDKDLSQANVRDMDSSLASTPASLLSGSTSVSTQFTVTALPPSSGLPIGSCW